MSSDNELDAMTDEQAAEHYYRHRNEIEHEPGEPVEIEPVRPLSLVVSVRLREDEAEQVRAAATYGAWLAKQEIHSLSAGS